MGFPLPRPARLAVFASGRGSNLAALLEAFPPGEPVGSVVLVVSDRANAGALEKARKAGIEAVVIPFAERADFEREALNLLNVHAIDLVCLAGFTRLLSSAFVDEYAGRILNIHPSLLPAFRGLHAQRRALAAGVSVSGCTVHVVDAGMDTGPILLQRKVPILKGDSEAALSERILAEEHRAYPEGVRRVLRGVLERAR